MTDPAPADTKPLSGEMRPPEWKGMDDFALGIDGNRIPADDAMTGQVIEIDDGGNSRLRLEFISGSEVSRTRDGETTSDWYEHLMMRPGVHYFSFTFAARPRHGEVIVVDENSGHTLTVADDIADAPTPGRPRVAQSFTPGTLVGVNRIGEVPAPTRDLIGWRAQYRYSPNHLYEHVYLSSKRYAWQCIVGEQRGHGDVDLSSAWKLGEKLYVFTWTEFLIPVAATWLYDLEKMRTVGTFFGLGNDGAVSCKPAGAYITELGRVRYPEDEPV